MRVQIYGKTGCTFCNQAVELCKRNNIGYDYKHVGSDIQLEQLEEMVGQPVKTIPQIFISEDGLTQYVGGYSEFVAKVVTPNESNLF